MKLSRKSKIVVALLAVWMLAVGSGLRVMLAYDNTPGIIATSSTMWPADSHLSRQAGVATLVMMIHPHCPCSRASVSELSLLLARVQGRVNANVLFVRPLGVPANWEIAELWTSVAWMPGVKLRVDNDGVEAHRFGSTTSGQVMLYNTQGRLLFRGGITASRGHSGENDGRSAIVALLTQGQADTDETPVFGCQLIGTMKNPEEFCDASHKN